MSGEKPKLLVLGASPEAAERLRSAVGGEYDLATTPTPPGDLAAGLLRTIGEALCVADERGGVVWANDVFLALEAPARARIFEAVRDWFTAIRTVAAHNHDPAVPFGARRFELNSADGSRWFEVEISAMPRGMLAPDPAAIPASGPTPTGQAGGGAAAAVGGELALAGVVVRDVTAAKRFRLKVASIDRAGADLLRLDAEEIRRMHPAERLKLAEVKIVKHSKEILDFDHFAVRLLDPKTGRLELVLSHGMPSTFGDIEIHASTTENGTSGWVAATGKSYLVTDASRDPLFLPGLTGARSSLTVPLTLNDRVIGIMDIESQQPAAFDEEDLQFAEIFTRYVSLAMHQLDLLVVERSATNDAASNRVAGELARPLADILEQADELISSGQLSGPAAMRLDRIRVDVAFIRERVRELASGPQTILNVERELAEEGHDPLIAGKRVLIADDEPKIRKIIGDVLRHRGALVTPCDSGETAIATLERVQAGEIPPFDLVLSDIKMPDRTGYDVFSMARRVRPDLPVILMTGFGYDPHHSIVRASQEGCKQVLFKPFEAATLLEEVRKGLRPPGPPPAV
jgi:CheY-like chemotaxis protein